MTNNSQLIGLGAIVVVAMLVTMAVAVVTCVWLAHRLVKAPNATAIGAVAGVSLGALVIVVAFFDTLVFPPMTLRLETPKSFAYPTVFVVADPASSLQVNWQGWNMPFIAKHARLAVPDSGVVYVRSLGVLDNGHVVAELADGRLSTGQGTADYRGSRVVMYEFSAGEDPEFMMSLLDEKKLTAVLRQRGRAAP